MEAIANTDFTICIRLVILGNHRNALRIFSGRKLVPAKLEEFTHRFFNNGKTTSLLISLINSSSNHFAQGRFSSHGP